MQRITAVLRRFTPALMLSAVAAAPGMALAAYPEQPIKMVVAYAPGGGSDMIARLAAQYMAKYLGNNASIVVVNRPGAAATADSTRAGMKRRRRAVMRCMSGVSLGLSWG